MCKDHDTITYYKSKLWLYLLLFVVLSCRRGRIYVSQYNMRIGVCIYSVCWLSSCIVTPYGFITNLDLLEEWSLDSKELWEVGPLWSEALKGCFGSNHSTCPKILKYWGEAVSSPSPHACAGERVILSPGQRASLAPPNGPQNCGMCHVSLPLLLKHAPLPPSIWIKEKSRNSRKLASQ